MWIAYPYGGLMRSTHLVIVVLLTLIIGCAIGYSIGQARVATVTTTYTVTVTSTITEAIVRASPTSVVDALGRVVTFEEPPKRVISLAPSITEILFALGLDDRVIGVTEYCNYPPKVLELVKKGRISVIGGYWTPDVEKIIALKPDLVVGAAGTRPHVALAEKLKELNIKTLYVGGSGATDDVKVFMDIATVAKVFRVEDRAEELINEIKSEISYISVKLKELNVTRPKVLILIGPPAWGLWSVGGDTFLGWIVSTAGGINIAQRFSGWPRLDYEYIISQDPEVIIMTGMGAKPEDIVKEFENSPLKGVKAFRDGQIYVVDEEAGDILVRPGPRIGKAVKLVAQILYPGIFGEPEVRVVYKVMG